MSIHLHRLFTFLSLAVDITCWLVLGGFSLWVTRPAFQFFSIRFFALDLTFYRLMKAGYFMLSSVPA